MPENKELHANHRQRMRKRFAQQGGFSGFAEHEVLEYILYLAIPRRDTNPLAHRLIDRFGSLCQVLEASEADILTVEGAGPAVARLLTTMHAANRYYSQNRARAPRAFQDLEEVAVYLIPQFYGAVTEQVYVLFLDDRNCPIKLQKVTEGTVNEAAMARTQIARLAVQCHATQAVLAHNHPAGAALPSPADLQFTRELANALASLGIRFLDHIIVDKEGDYISLQQSGRMPAAEPTLMQGVAGSKEKALEQDKKENHGSVYTCFQLSAHRRSAPGH